jgi:transposase
MPAVDMPTDFWGSIARVGIRICYRSVFDERWTVESKHLGNGIAWHLVDGCAPQDTSASF